MTKDDGETSRFAQDIVNSASTLCTEGTVSGTILHVFRWDTSSLWHLGGQFGTRLFEIGV